MTEPEVRPRVFISHSGKDGQVGELIAALENLLHDDYQVLIDERNIGPGPFREPIDDMIRKCDAAIVIISPRALEPDRAWVRTEAAMLGLKARENRAFGLIPVYIEGTSPDDVRSREWDPTFISELNCAGGDDVQVVAADVVRRLRPVRDHFLASGIERDLAVPLRKVHPDTLRDAVAPLFEDPSDAWIAGDLALQAARRLLRADAETVARVVDGLINEDVARATRILNIVLPFTWVNPSAAVAIRAAIEGCRTVWLNTRQLESAKAHVSCASPRLPFWQILGTEEAVDPENSADLVADLRAAMAHAAGELEAKKTKLLGRPSGPRVFAVPCSIDDADIRAIFEDDEFSGFAKIFMAGEVSWGTMPASRLDGLELVRPELERADEEKGLDNCKVLIAILEEAKADLEAGRR